MKIMNDTSQKSRSGKLPGVLRTPSVKHSLLTVLLLKDPEDE